MLCNCHKFFDFFNLLAIILIRYFSSKLALKKEYFFIKYMFFEGVEKESEIYFWRSHLVCEL